MNRTPVSGANQVFALSMSSPFFSRSRGFPAGRLADVCRRRHPNVAASEAARARARLFVPRFFFFFFKKKKKKKGGGGECADSAGPNATTTSRPERLPPAAQCSVMDVRLTHIGGPTVLIEVVGWRLLTDPTFDPPGRRYYFGWGAGSRKIAGPAVAAADLRPVDAVLLSHYRARRQPGRRRPLVVPLGGRRVNHRHRREAAWAATCAG